MRVGSAIVAILVAVCVAVLLTPARAWAASSRSPARRAATPVTVKMVGDQLTFDPPRVVVRRGQTVEWRNQGNQIHNILDDAAKATNKADVGAPAGATPFDSGLLKPGQNYSHRFTVRGTYRYVCTLHEAQGMKGEIVVK